MIACSTKSNSIYLLTLVGQQITGSKVIKEAHSKDINSLRWNRNDTRLLSTGSDCMINLYCTKQAQVLLKINLHKSAVFTGVYHPITGQIYSGGIDNWIGVWTENGQFVSLSD
jgi:WD40 repeat protein